MIDVFISYKSEEREFAKVIAETLVRLGYTVWWDTNLLPGDKFEEEIEAIIGQSRTMIVIWSKQSVQSSWVRAEVNEALSQNKLVFPLLLDRVKAPLRVRHEIQSISIENWRRTPNSNDLTPVTVALEKHLGPKYQSGIDKNEKNYSELTRYNVEAEYWRAIAAATPQRSDEYKSYLEKFGERAHWADLAAERIRALDNEQDRLNWGKLAIQIGPFAALAAAVLGIVAAGMQFWPSERAEGDQFQRESLRTDASAGNEPYEAKTEILELESDRQSSVFDENNTEPEAKTESSGDLRDTSASRVVKEEEISSSMKTDADSMDEVPDNWQDHQFASYGRDFVIAALLKDSGGQLNELTVANDSLEPFDKEILYSFACQKGSDMGCRNEAFALRLTYDGNKMDRARQVSRDLCVEGRLPLSCLDFADWFYVKPEELRTFYNLLIGYEGSDSFTDSERYQRVKNKLGDRLYKEVWSSTPTEFDLQNLGRLNLSEQVRTRLLADIEALDREPYELSGIPAEHARILNRARVQTTQIKGEIEKLRASVERSQSLGIAARAIDARVPTSSWNENYDFFGQRGGRPTISNGIITRKTDQAVLNDQVSYWVVVDTNPTVRCFYSEYSEKRTCGEMKSIPSESGLGFEGAADERYIGEYVAGERSGVGERLVDSPWSDSVERYGFIPGKFEGEYKENRWNGLGVMWSIDGRRFVAGKWMGDQLISVDARN